jgi:hypothetical protein
MAEPAPRFASFAEFWPFYLAQHRHPRTRAMHFAGLGVGALLLAAALVTRAWVWALAAPVAAYALSWLGHGLIERNRPATFVYPLWSLGADFRMAWLALLGRLTAELSKHGLR